MENSISEPSKGIAVKRIILLVVVLLFAVIVSGYIILRLGMNAEPPPHYWKYAITSDAEKICNSLCTGATNLSSAIEFCSTAFSIDWNHDGYIGSATQNGGLFFCENKVPCFVVVPGCKNKYDGKHCRDLLARYAPDKYYHLFLDSQDNPQPPSSPTDYSDGCSLPSSQSCRKQEECLPGVEADGQYPTHYNWKEMVCFSSNVTEVLAANFTCAGDSRE